MNLSDLPSMPRDQWPTDESHLWGIAEELVTKGFMFKCKQACSLDRVVFESGWMNRKTGLTASELGAPVHQALFVAAMRDRV